MITPSPHAPSTTTARPPALPAMHQPAGCGQRAAGGAEPGFTLRVPGDVRTEALIAEIERRGYVCVKAPQPVWLTPGEFCAAHGYHNAWLTRLIKTRRKTVPGLELQLGPSGRRVLLVRARPEFYQWLGRLEGPGHRLDIRAASARIEETLLKQEPSGARQPAAGCPQGPRGSAEQHRKAGKTLGGVKA